MIEADSETDVANRQHRARFFRAEWADDGSLEGHVRLPPEAGAILLEAVEIARSHIPPEPEPDDVMRSAERTGGPAPTNSDALLLAETFIMHATPESGGDRFQVVINVDRDALADDAD